MYEQEMTLRQLRSGSTLPA